MTWIPKLALYANAIVADRDKSTSDRWASGVSGLVEPSALSSRQPREHMSTIDWDRIESTWEPDTLRETVLTFLAGASGPTAIVAGHIIISRARDPQITKEFPYEGVLPAKTPEGRYEVNACGLFTWMQAMKIHCLAQERGLPTPKLVYLWANFDYDSEERQARLERTEPPDFPTAVPAQLCEMLGPFDIGPEQVRAFSESNLRNRVSRKIGLMSTRGPQDRMFFDRPIIEEGGRLFVLDDEKRPIPLSTVNGAPVCKPILAGFIDAVLAGHDRVACLWPRQEVGCRYREHLRILGRRKAARVMEVYCDLTLAPVSNEHGFQYVPVWTKPKRGG